MSGLEEKDAYDFDVVGDQNPRAQENTPANEFVETAEERREAAKKAIPPDNLRFDVV
jgi:hypothetical protein